LKAVGHFGVLKIRASTSSAPDSLLEETISLESTGRHRNPLAKLAVRWSRRGEMRHLCTDPGWPHRQTRGSGRRGAVPRLRVAVGHPLYVDH
jgi:hypothetical protein